MGRWKEQVGADGQKQAYWDGSDSGPDQIAAPVQQRTPPMIPNAGNNGGWGSEGPGGITGRAQEPGYSDLKQLPVSPMPPVPVGNGGDMTMMPGQGGMWDWQHGGEKGNGQLDAILQMLQQKFGTKGGLIGSLASKAAATPPTAPKPGGFMSGMKSLGGALGGLFGR